MQVNGPDGNEQERRRLKQRVVELEAINDRLRNEVRDLHHVAHQFKYPPDAKLLRYIADEIDCGPCENMAVEWDTNASHCPKEENGECSAANAWVLREFAKAVETALCTHVWQEHDIYGENCTKCGLHREVTTG